MLDDDGRVVGIVTRHDLLKPFHRSDDAMLTEIERLLASPLWVPEAHEARATVDAGVVTLEGIVQWPSDVGVFEAVAARVPGVVGVENRLTAREPEPRLSSLAPPG